MLWRSPRMRSVSVSNPGHDKPESLSRRLHSPCQTPSIFVVIVARSLDWPLNIEFSFQTKYGTMKKNPCPMAARAEHWLVAKMCQP